MTAGKEGGAKSRGGRAVEKSRKDGTNRLPLGITSISEDEGEGIEGRFRVAKKVERGAPLHFEVGGLQGRRNLW